MRQLYFLVLCLFSCLTLSAQDTFSIVAVDPATGEVGSAGATCLDVVVEGASAIIISDVLPGRGAIHTQSFWIQANQNNAKSRMILGFSPAAIIDWLEDNDVQNNPAVRQYGIVDFDDDGQPRAAAFTGINCFDYKGQRVGENYAIQGNILIGAEVLDAMEAHFLETEGSLAQKLMAAMQGANIPGADSRCLEEGVSSRSSFLRVALPDDEPNELYLDLVIESTPVGVEPIDSLQQAFDAWLLTSTHQAGYLNSLISVFPNPAKAQVTLDRSLLPEKGPMLLEVFDINGKKLLEHRVNNDFETLDTNQLKGSGTFILKLSNKQGQLLHLTKLLVIP